MPLLTSHLPPLRASFTLSWSCAWECKIHKATRKECDASASCLKGSPTDKV